MNRGAKADEHSAAMVTVSAWISKGWLPASDAMTVRGEPTWTLESIAEKMAGVGVDEFLRLVRPQAVDERRHNESPYSLVR
ncbi:hypothetical protein JCM19379_29570 [Methyloparacoccus murrellii]